MSFKEIDSKKTLPELEEEILSFWEKEEIFEKSIENRKSGENYSFYDGPPFATGTPHYGHLVASTMKDVVPRYFTMKGYKVERKWGWDCHGLPIENIAEQSLGIKNKKEIEAMSVEKFNDVCRSKVLEYVHEWEKVIPRLGRFVDMKNAYKTMDLDFMESVWWVFKQLWDKDLIYEGYRSMHICPRCETTLSQSEVTEGYKTIKDLSVVAKFELLREVDEKINDLYKGQDDAPIYILAWTTTPWTLIGNVALAVGKDIDYVQIKMKDSGELYILAKDRLEIIKEEFDIIDTFKGEKMVGTHYIPLFNYYDSNNPNLKNIENGWQIYDAPFVTIEEGTGVVHIAPAFGEDDLNLAKDKNLPFIQHIGMDGIIEDKAGEFAGLHVKPIEDVQSTDVAIIKYLAKNNLLYSKEQYEHSYPHCWRCETPLLHYATTSWFVAVTKVKEDALRLAKDINWSPKHMKEGRFGKWLEGARDWSISRQRYWASVIPIWKCGCGEIKVIGSVKVLEDLSSQKITDIHKDKVDQITFKCVKCSNEMRRIPDVLDTWFDSGSMPFAQLHYPFENEEKFNLNFPAKFIAEGQDQTRAWFYYLHILSVAVKEKRSFDNVVVNGTVLAEDGKKMSKRLKNYPDPMEVINKYGADSLRMYLLTSSVMQAENLNFSEKDLSEMSKGFFRMLWNSYSFFTMYANIDKWEPGNRKEGTENILDKWIISELNILIKEVNQNMQNYELTKAARLFVPFVDNLSNWYIRRSRKRFQKQNNLQDKLFAYETLYEVLVELSKLLAPFAPFISEEIYKNLTNEVSVHLTEYPTFEESLIDNEINNDMKESKKIVEMGLSARSVLGSEYKVRQPLGYLKYGKQISKDLRDEYKMIISEEVNVRQVIYDENCEGVEVDKIISDALKGEGLKNEIIRQIQDLRKKAGYFPNDKVVLFYETATKLAEIISKFESEIKTETNLSEIEKSKNECDMEIESNLSGENVWFGVKK